MNTIPQPPETAVLHCFKCRQATAHVRILSSRPVFRCSGGCGNTREIEELGRVPIPRLISMPPPREKPAKPPIFSKETLTQTKYWRPKMKTTADALTQKIDERIKEHTSEAKLGAGDLLSLLEHDDVRAKIGEIVSAALGLGGDTGRRNRPTEPASPGACPRAPHKGRHGRACRDAGYAG